MTSTVSYDNGLQVKYAPLGHAEQTVGGSPVGLPTIPNEDRVRRVVIRPLSADIYWTDDGSTPSAAHGMLIYKDEIVVYDGLDLAAFKMYSAGSADVRVIYYGI